MHYLYMKNYNYIEKFSIMKKNILNETVKKMQRTAKMMPKTINEAIDFNDDEVLEDSEEEEYPSHEMSNVQPSENASQKAAALIDSIRKQALRAMAELADTPEDENYIMLKKVWQMTDRKPEKEEKDAIQH